VLVADDDPISRLLITRFLNLWGYEVVAASDGDQAWQMLQQEDAPPIAILDWMMPGLDGIEICRRIRTSREAGRYRFLILLTARNSRDDVLRGLDAGADDYLTKPVDAAEMKARLMIARRIVDLQERLMQAVEVNRYEATHDALTGFWNRAAMLEFLHGQFARSSRNGISVALVLADVDHFKKVNDEHGHLAGDAVLRELAARLKKIVRPYDWIGRYGGEEFLVVAPDCTMSNAYAVCERLRAAVGDKPILCSGDSVQVTMSFGVATTAETGVGDEDSLLRAADTALYAAKQQGRNRVEMAKRSPRLRPRHFRPGDAAKAKELVQ
jgi:diguanylate cyclase (GGDEF)-like protein